MEHLKVQNFLVIKEADIEVKRLTLIIGPQANGKSIVAKLLYFFRVFISETYLQSVRNLENKRQIEKTGKSDFEQYFPKYTWSNQPFKIKYQNDDFEITLIRSKNKHGKFATKLDYSKNMAEFHRNLKRIIKKKKKEAEAEEPSDRRRRITARRSNLFFELMNNHVYNSKFGNSFQESEFIPASRSFFANLQKNVFSFLASNLNVDPFIKDFGSSYETAKSFYERQPIQLSTAVGRIRRYSEKILNGHYKYEKEQDWIENKNGRINVSNASSGQQESLPMLIILSVLPFVRFGGRNRKFTFFIEEPEAHLFPISQKHVVSIISLIYNATHHNFVITTHSPYILTAINNMVYASEVSKNMDPEIIKAMTGFDRQHYIQYEDIVAYTIRNGILESIMEEEEKLIGASVIDSVSDEFEEVFNSLMELQLDNGE